MGPCMCGGCRSCLEAQGYNTNGPFWTVVFDDGKGPAIEVETFDDENDAEACLEACQDETHMAWLYIVEEDVI